MMTLGQKIQTIRKEAGLSQEAFGEVLHVSRQAVSKWEGDGGVPELDTLILISRRFHVSLNDLLGMEDEEEGLTPPDAPLSPEMQEMQDAMMHPCAPEAPKPEQEQTSDAFSPQTPEANEPKQDKSRIFLSNKAKILLCSVLAGLLLWFAIFRPIAEMKALRAQLSTMQSRITVLENLVSSQNSSLRSTILSVLEEQNDPVSSMDIQVSSCDYSAGNVTLSLSAQLKSTAPETQVQFLLQWTDEAGQTQQNETDWVSAYPNAQAQFTLSLHESDAQLFCCLRLQSADGTIQHSPWKSAGLALSKEALQLQLKGSLYELTSLTYAASFGDSSATTTPENPSLTLYAPFSDLQPRSAQYTLLLDGEIILDMPMTVSHTKNMDEGCYLLSPESDVDFPLKLSLQKGQTLTYLLQVTDNFGQTITFQTTCVAEEDGLVFEDAATPVQAD